MLTVAGSVALEAHYIMKRFAVFMSSAATPEEFDVAFARLSAEGIKGVVLLVDASNIEHAEKIAKLAQQARLPTAYQRRENVEVGGLVAVPPSLLAIADEVIERVRLLHLLRSPIGTVLTKPDLALCPQLARADISRKGGLLVLTLCDISGPDCRAKCLNAVPGRTERMGMLS